MLAKRDLGRVTLKYRSYGDRDRTARTREWAGGDRYTPGNSNSTTCCAAPVTGTDPGDKVKVGLMATSREATRSPTTPSPKRPAGAGTVGRGLHGRLRPPAGGPVLPVLLHGHIEREGVAFDVYDVDAAGRTAPDDLGVLSHYDAVVSYTGDDVVTRGLGWAPGNASRWRCGTLRGTGLHRRGRPRPLHRKDPPDSSTRRVSARSSTTRSRIASAAPTPRAGGLPGAVGLRRFARRPDPVLVRRDDHDARRRERPGHRGPVRRRRPGRPFAGLRWGFNGADSAQK